MNRIIPALVFITLSGARIANTHARGSESALAAMRLGGTWIHVRSVTAEGTDTTFDGRYDREVSDTNSLTVERAFIFSADTVFEYFRGKSCWYLDNYPYQIRGDTLSCRRPRCINPVSSASRSFISAYLIEFISDSVVFQLLAPSERTVKDYYQKYHGRLPLPEWPDSACGPRRCAPGWLRSDF